MTQEQDKQLLAEFCGYKFHKDYPRFVFKSQAFELCEMFNDYNSIMEVVEKIEKGRSYIVRICGNTCQIEDVRDDFCIAFKMCNTKNEAILSACVAFVKWWNENKKEAK